MTTGKCREMVSGWCSMAGRQSGYREDPQGLFRYKSRYSRVALRSLRTRRQSDLYLRIPDRGLHRTSRPPD
ncbi:hypothetical protein DPMN_064576 [Dreissena polymorpha]|uniref:Uncharacterized protein n=1 Tax=Dreissena polymorpha TaxID=45954 RepID=A0A9D4HK81_DREPO|nr:hypothetical protein DPMN_064576 [Dreissena polymorpha]